MLYERRHTREIDAYGGILKIMPIFGAEFFFWIVTFGSIGLPPLNGFIGEFLILYGVFEAGGTNVSRVRSACGYRSYMERGLYAMDVRAHDVSAKSRMKKTNLQGFRSKRASGFNSDCDFDFRDRPFQPASYKKSSRALSTLWTWHRERLSRRRFSRLLPPQRPHPAGLEPNSAGERSGKYVDH